MANVMSLCEEKHETELPQLPTIPPKAIPDKRAAIARNYHDLHNLFQYLVWTSIYVVKLSLSVVYIYVFIYSFTFSDKTVNFFHPFLASFITEMTEKTCPISS